MLGECRPAASAMALARLPRPQDISYHAAAVAGVECRKAYHAPAAEEPAGYDVAPERLRFFSLTDFHLTFSL